MNDVIKAYCILDKAQLLVSAERAARALGIWNEVANNSNDGLWALATMPDAPATSRVGSEPVVEIATEPNPGFRQGPPPSPVRVKQPRKVG